MKNWSLHDCGYTLHLPYGKDPERKWIGSKDEEIL